MLLNSNFVKGTASVLRPTFLHFSPSIGLVANCSPSIIANLRNYGDTSNLVAHFFYQRKDDSGRRYGPVSVSNSKSQAAFWLTTKQLGYFIGLAMNHASTNVRLTFFRVIRNSRQ